MQKTNKLAILSFALASIFMSIAAKGAVNYTYISVTLVSFLFVILSLYATIRSRNAEYLIIGSLLLSLSTLVALTELLTRKISDLQYGSYFFAFLGSVGLLSLVLIAIYLLDEGWSFSRDKAREALSVCAAILGFVLAIASAFVP